MTPREFLKYVQRHCNHNDVEFVLGPKDLQYPGNKGPVAGFFCPPQGDEPATLAFAYKGVKVDDWFPVLVHEFAHMQQWLDNCPAWRAGELSTREKIFFPAYKDGDAYDIFFDWIDGKIELDPNRVEDFANRAMECELDAEKRSAELIKELYLPINLEEYIQKGNSYAYFYKYIAIKRKWYESGKAPYTVENCWRQFPKDWDTINYYRPIGNKYIRLYEQLYDEK